MHPVISVSNLSKHFKARKNNGLIKGIFNPEYKVVEAVTDISFSVQKGEAVAFLGPNGAGKTTTTKMMTGLVHPSGGQVEVLGFTPFERKEVFLKRIGLVMGNKAGLNWDLTPVQSFDLLRGIYGIDLDTYKKRLKELTELLEVEHKLETQLRRLSLGERMKMELIGAILHAPEVLFLDEPTIGLDIVTKKNVRQFLRRIQRESGTTLILTSHDMDDVEQVCDRVIIINKGRKIYDDSLQALSAQYRAFRYVRFTFSVPPREGLLTGVGEVLESNPDTALLKVPAEALIEAISTVMKETELLDMHTEGVPLEEIIEEVFKRDAL
jgi:ABC-2 type transport system ATP-binding protein